ncbi:MAG: hypothetical protein QGG40_06575 [Myxococcota bacterium]|nr:hypothetical protein [Myxococcota bacterium]
MSGFEQEFPEQVRIANIDATTPESKTAVAALGFQSHGLVVRSAGGEELFKQADHSVNVDEVRAALQGMSSP